MSLTLTQSDTAPALTGACLNGATPADLTGITAIVANILRPDATVLVKTPTVVLATAGTYSIAWVNGDLGQVGNHLLEVQVTYASGKIQTFGPVQFTVRAQIA